MTSFVPDLGSPEFLRDPFPAYQRLRDEHPVCYIPDRRLWTVSRWNDVLEVLTRPDVFSSVGKAAFGYSPTKSGFQGTMIGADPPEHTRIRKRLAAAFSAEALAAMEAHVRGHVIRLIDQVAGRGECEFMSAFARPLPVLVTAEMLGIDVEDCDALAEWADAAVHAGGPGAPSGPKLPDTYFDTYIERCCTRTPRGVLDVLLQSDRGDGRLTPAEARDLAMLLVLGGVETTTNLLGNAMAALLKYPDQLRLLIEDPGLIPSMIEESLRFDTPAQNVKRRTTRDVELAGVAIPSEALVLVLLGSANRDPAHFPDADRFSIARQPNDHIAFGRGPHFCLGARLARLEARVACEVMFARLRNIRPAQPLEEIRFVESAVMRGPRLLKIAFDPS